MLMRVHLQDCDDLFVRDLFGNTFPNHALAHGEIVRGRSDPGRRLVLDVGNGPRDGFAIPGARRAEGRGRKGRIAAPRRLGGTPPNAFAAVESRNGPAAKSTTNALRLSAM